MPYQPDQMTYRIDAVSTFAAEATHSVTPSDTRKQIAFWGRSRLLLESLSQRLEQDADLNGCGMVDESHTASIVTTPDAIIIEVSTGTELVEAQRRFPEVRLIALKPVDSDNAAETSGLLATWPWQISLHDSVAQFLSVVRSAAGCRSNCAEPAADALSPADRLRGLSRRELEVFRLLARGDSVKEVARVLGLSFKAVDSQKYRIMRKLGLTDRVQVTRLAIRAGLITP